ncbi:hypothetical protein B296_00000240 [Ensete ventricosum]|uniref:Uncharacterized protein n=1 Tax=Ensete ventricosum TaxID=4639 RepID=A0A426YQF5_ENSVE|nr:hypothetical protein B296_00000240 [Ensete ventricosum]
MEEELQEHEEEVADEEQQPVDMTMHALAGYGGARKGLLACGETIGATPARASPQGLAVHDEATGAAPAQKIAYVLDTIVPTLEEGASEDEIAHYVKYIDDSMLAKCYILVSMTPELQK